MLDTVSYIGDILSFYLDYQANEGYLKTAVEFPNILKIGKQEGWKYQANPSSYGIASMYVIVPALSTGTGPDTDYIPILKRGSGFRSLSGAAFMLNQDVDFADSNNQVVVASVDDSTGLPLSFAIRAFGQVVSGKLVQELHTIGAYEAFKRITMGSTNIAEIVSVIDQEGHDYYGVDFLSQNVVYRAIANQDQDEKELALSLLRPFAAPRRFIVDRERVKTYLQFGAGTETDLTQDNEIVDPASVILQVHGKNYITDTGFDPAKLIASDKFGIAPSNTILRVVARVNTASDVNIASGTLTQVVSPRFEFSDPLNLNMTTMLSVRNSLEVDNDDPIVGDVSLPSKEELKLRISSNHAAQNRAVTDIDHEAIIYRMPSQFGSVKRVKVVRDNDSFRRNLNVYLISENADGTLTEANDSLKNNVKMWLSGYKMLSDTIDLLDARIVNLGITFTAIANSTSKFTALTAAREALQERYARIHDISEAFSITEIYNILNDLDEIVDVTDVEITVKNGGLYSDTRFNVTDQLSADGRYVACPKNVVFEIRYPTIDIQGVIV
jgi:hypothetical protein